MSTSMNTTLLTLTLSLLLVACGAPMGPSGDEDGGTDAGTTTSDAGPANAPGSPADGLCRGNVRRDDGILETRYFGLDANARPRCTFTCREGWVTCTEACDSQPQFGRGGCGACGVVCPSGTFCQRDTPDTRVSPLYCRTAP